MVLVIGQAQLEDSAVLERLARLLIVNDLEAHNGKFDFRWLNNKLNRYLGGQRLYVTDDTMLMHHSLYPGAAEHGLKVTAQRILGAPEWEAGLEKYTKGSKAHYERIPQEVLCRYNAQDVYWTWQLGDYFRDRLAIEPNALKAYREMELPASRMFQDVESHGIKVDVEYGEEIGGEMQEQIEHAETYMEVVTGIEGFNYRSVPQVTKYFADHGLRIASTNEATLVSLIQSDVEAEFCRAVLDGRKVSKSFGTYVKGPLARVRNGRVHPTFHVHGTTTGRTSCSRPNVQNLTNDSDESSSLRRLYIADDGKLMVGVDYAQAELRVIAELSGDELMIYDLRDGADDFFDIMLPSIFPEVDFTKLSKNERKPYRLMLKRIVYGSNYGRQARAIAAQLTLEGTPTTEEQAQAILDNYLGRYPQLRDWRADVMKGVKIGDWVTPFGRRFQQDILTYSNYGNVRNAALAFMPQSIASDICITAAMSIHRQMPKGSHIFATVHDAIYAESWEDDAVGVKELIQYEMTAAATALYTRVPFPTEGKIGSSWDKV